MYPYFYQWILLLKTSEIFIALIACSILSAIITILMKYWAELPTRYLKYRALKVLGNKFVIFLSNRGGCIYTTTLCHLQAYSRIDYFETYSMICRLDLLWATFILNLYYFTNISIKSLHLLTLVLSNLICQLKVAPLKLS